MNTNNLYFSICIENSLIKKNLRNSIIEAFVVKMYK